jgi:hypothetical protein
MTDQLQHPTLDGRPVMIGDLLEADDPDRTDPETGDPVVVQFHVGSITYDHGNWLHKGDEPVGWTVAAADVDESDFDFPLSECRRVEDWAGLPQPRDRNAWKLEVRDRWKPILDQLPVDTTVLANGSAYWTKDPQPNPMGGDVWTSGHNHVSTIVLLKLHDDFEVIP